MPLGSKHRAETREGFGEKKERNAGAEGGKRT